MYLKTVLHILWNEMFIFKGKKNANEKFYLNISVTLSLSIIEQKHYLPIWPDLYLQNTPLNKSNFF